MKCILNDCNNEAIEKQLPFISKTQYNNGFKLCQEHYDNTYKHNLQLLKNKIKKQIMKFYTDWEITDEDFVQKEIIKELEKL